MPETARLLREGTLVAHRMAVGLPTSTPAFQAAVMYGGPVDVPAFEYLDKTTLQYHWFVQPWTSAQADERHGRGRRGILEGGRAYGCVLSGGAADSVLTFAGLLRLSPGWVKFGLLGMIGQVVGLAGALGRAVASTTKQFLCAPGRRRGPRSSDAGRMRSLWHRVLREFFTLGVLADIRAGVPAVYVNYVGYDVVSHAWGPAHRNALRALRPIDRSIGQIARAIREQHTHEYELYVLSDHGQLQSVPFEAVSGGLPVGEVVLRALQVEHEPVTSIVHGGGRRGVWAEGLCIVPAGPNMNIYLTDRPGHATEAEL